MQMPRRWLGLLAILLLFCIGVGLMSAALPDEANTSGYYDGDDDDAAVAPHRMVVLVDMASGARAVVLREGAPAFESPVESAIAPIVEQSPPPPLRSPPDV